MSKDLRKTIILTLDPTQWKPSMKEQISWPPIFSVIALYAEESRSLQLPQTLAIACVMFSYNRPDRKKTF